MNITYLNIFLRCVTIFLFARYHGVSAEEENPHIITDGTPAEIGEYPYIVSIESDNYGHNCGGTLIAPGYVLSAAHCHGFNPKVVIGTNDLSDQSGSSVEVHEVEYEVVHPDYDCNTIQDDVMVLKLATDSSYTPVSYDKGSTSYSPGTNVTVVGWGKISYEGPLSDVLLEASVEIQENSVCAEPYTTVNHVVTDDMLCTYDDTKGFCSGDSGGPLLIKEGGNHTQIGIVSHSFYECENPAYADVYMKTSSYADFIECVTNGGSDDCGDVCSEENLKHTMEVGLLNLILTVMKTSN